MKASYLFLVCLLATTTFASNIVTQSQPSKLQFDDSGFILVAKGIFEGMSFVESWDQFMPCISSTEDAVQNIIIAVEDLRKQDAIDVARGLIALARAIEDLPVSIKSCGAATTGIEKLVTAIQALINPATFVYVVSKNLIINGADIYHEIATAISDFETGSWELFGYNVGEALAQIFLHSANPTKLKQSIAADVLLFFKGVAQGISTDIPYNELAPCVNEASTIGIVLNQAVNDFITEETTKVIQGVMLLAKVLRSIPTAIKDCSVAYTQFDQLLQAISLLEDPRVMVYHVARSLMVHGQEIWDEITDATDHIKKGDYETAGQDIGTIIANFLRPDAAVSGRRFTNLLAKTAPFEVNHNHKFVNWTIGELKTLFGTKLEDKSQSKIPIDNSHYLDENLPQNFSSWTQWPNCEHEILDQAKCGSCWAFGAAETLSDRFCIASNGSVNVQLSPQYLVSCSTGNMGCNGGILTLAWGSLERSGLPTLECEPYESQEGEAPSCSKLEEGCKDGTPLKRYYAKSWSTRWYMSTESIKTEIFKNGPVESAFTVYEDFMAYAGGVYKHTSGGVLGGHAIKIVGWGNEDGQDYWLVANSWGTNWGLQGYFKMAIGDSSMDGNGIAGQADIDNLPTKTATKLRLPRNFLRDIVNI